MSEQKTRNDRLLSLISSGSLSMLVLARVLDCPEASIRRSIGELRAEGYHVDVWLGQVRSYGLRSALAAGTAAEGTNGNEATL